MIEPAPSDDILSWLRLTLVPGFTASQQRKLLLAAGSPSAAAACMASQPSERLVEKTLRWLEAPGHHFVTFGSSLYSRVLADIHDPPLVLYVDGRAELLDAPGFAIVGSRNATPQGKRDAHAFAQALSDYGLTIVSGLALGIDAAAHAGGLQGAASSVAVVGTGIDVTYPRANDVLARELAEKGCLISEFPVGTQSVRGNFPRRNRLISGMTRGVLVVEAGMPSGTLVTAGYAIDQGREVFAMPGSIHGPHSKGCHHLIKQGAKLVENVEDILSEIRWALQSSPKPQPPAEACDEFLDAVGFGPATVDEIVSRSGIAVHDVAAHLSRLELDGRIAALPGGRYQRIRH